MGPEHAKLFAQAITNILSAPVSGSVAFLRCLTSDQVDVLADSDAFHVPGWTINAVIDVTGPRRITADQAVEQREDKGDAALLIIDPLRAGAGLDGIYSAGREIGEAELFNETLALARKPFWGHMSVLDEAIRRAERLGRRRRLTPWAKFDFYISASRNAGRAVARLGLWPIACEGYPSSSELDLSAELADRLLYVNDTRVVSERVRALVLEEADTDGPELERALRSIAGLSPEESARRIEGQPNLWLGAIKPGFASEALRSIQLTSWRDAKGNLLKWSGLINGEGEETTPRLVLDRNAATKDRAQCVMRWTTNPDGIAAGSVDYRISVVAGEDLLAERVVSHRDHRYQQVVLGVDDFDELEGNEKFDAIVQVIAIGLDDVAVVQSEPITLEFGEAAKSLSSASGQEVRTLIEGAIGVGDRDLFELLVAGPDAAIRPVEDRKGFINWKGEAASRGARVYRPWLLRAVERDWQARGGPIGHWIQVVRADGSPIGPLQFVELEPEDSNPSTERARDACRKLAGELGHAGLLGRVLTNGWGAADSYVNAWEKALDGGAPALALHGSIEVRSQSGQLIGLLVTPLHPVRFAWHAHYDQAIAHARYEQNLSPSHVHKSVSPIDSAFFPFALPGAGTRGFVFADVLGFHTVAMTVDGEREPKAATALLAACMSDDVAAASSIGEASAGAIARELGHYLDCYGGASGERPDLLTIQAWRAGDGLTVARALGQTLAARGVDEDDEAASSLCFTLDLFHAANPTSAGQFLANVGRRRRAGGHVLDARDRWLADTATRPGEVLVPRLRWAKHEEPAIEDDAAWNAVNAAHVSLAFDLFRTELDVVPTGTISDSRPLHAWGLVRALERRALDGEELAWITYAAPELTGEPSPDNRTASDRLRRIDRATARATARALGGGATDWPVLKTKLPAEDRIRLDRLHDRSDWVITLDRNAALDYFDAPRESPDTYERFVIDTVPERTDLAAIQLVTSTTNLDSVRDLVDEALSDMGLSSSERNSRFLISQLKGLSGRLAIRLSDGGTRTGELIALALVHAHCVSARGRGGTWLNVEQGVLIPVDEIADHAPIVLMARTDGESARRADFIHVSAPARGPLEFRFVEVKYRQHLRTARQPDMLEHMVAQMSELRQRWVDWFFSETLAPLDRVVRRAQLAKLLRFYADRARRHRLSERAYARLTNEVDQLVLKDVYQPGSISDPDVGYIFCPEHRTGQTERIIAEGSNTGLWLFGPTLLPDENSVTVTRLALSPALEEPAVSVELAGLAREDSAPPEDHDDTSDGGQLLREGAAVQSTPPSRSSQAPESTAVEPIMALPNMAQASPQSEAAPSREPVDKEISRVVPSTRPQRPPGATHLTRAEPVEILLGETLTAVPVCWPVSIRTNPHLMMVGLPGMGKTTSLINIAKQLTASGITPVIFSYHDDIDEKLSAAIGPMRTIDFDGLGFNPLRVDAPGPMAYIDVAGTLRDIFSSIFPDLGEIQLEELRGAIKQSYDDLGWNDRTRERPPSPRFRSFFDILRSRAKPNQNLLARLQELADYGFFDGDQEDAGILGDQQPTLIRVHLSTNDIVQRAFAAFVLYSIYKDMFRRGVQSRLTHAIIFDEAHRAAKLKLIPRFAKECRKYGLALALASQGVRDFDGALFEAVASYLVLRVTEADARVLARNTGATADQQRTTDRLKSLEPYQAMLFSAATAKPLMIRLAMG
ncbi:ATP-binding protein [Bradyrhizobium sp. HKCCYLRH1062]|uniref:ATP-binding protein n=1 Tax=unclassified Bradyrhizobium TaxID=2631580 RepID=UPI003EBEE949